MRVDARFGIECEQRRGVERGGERVDLCEAGRLFLNRDRIAPRFNARVADVPRHKRPVAVQELAGGEFAFDRLYRAGQLPALRNADDSLLRDAAIDDRFDDRANAGAVDADLIE